MLNFLIVFCMILGIIIVALVTQLAVLNQKLKAMGKRLLISQELEEINLSRAEADGFYNNILEADITNNRLIGNNSQSLLALMGLPKNATFTECIDRIIENMVHKDFVEEYRQNFDRENLLSRYASQNRNFSFEFIEKADLENYYWTRVTVCIYYSKASQAVKIISYVKNIQEEKNREQHLLTQVNTDYLTGIFNKRATEEKICKKLASEIDYTKSNAMVLFDIDKFKEINDKIGHAGGDAVLTAVGEIFRESFGENDIYGRIGGDEFLALMCGYEKDEDVFKRVDLILRSIHKLEKELSFGVGISASAGIAFYSKQADNYTDLFTYADCAMYEIKKGERNSYSIYRPK